MQVFLAEVARGEKDLAVAAGRLSTIFRFYKECTFGILSQLMCSQTFSLSYFVPLLKNLYLHVSIGYPILRLLLISVLKSNSTVEPR